MILPGTYERCMSGHYYAVVRGDEECPVCKQLAAKDAEIARLSAPVAGTYKAACQLACQWCAKEWPILSKGHFHLGFPEDGYQSCTAPTELEWGEQMARRVEELEKSEQFAVQLMKNCDVDNKVLYTKNEQLEAEVARLRRAMEPLKARFRELVCGDCEGRCRVCPADEVERALAPGEEAK